ncbi:MULTISPECIES: hypothetical protein [unclassified Pseudomonas]|uniref:hypothetical protein n=1 Tax=unclassified Pseudomonas TaxID=196821 RepID=UPI000CD12C77|nr:hypothetical protein [Pseudomonas sp. MPR-ANC1]POA46544.1 hypothetical protein C1893_19560 [Pseudomonas sp. MPR-ANC1]
MSFSIDDINEISQAFNRFEDGLILSFEFYYVPNEPLAATVVLHGRDHRAKGNVWKKIRITLTGVTELSARVMGNQFNSICSGVRLLKLNDLWCIDIDGNYALDADPSSLEEVRQDGDLYVIGRQIEIQDA